MSKGPLRINMIGIRLRLAERALIDAAAAANGETATQYGRRTLLAAAAAGTTQGRWYCQSCLAIAVSVPEKLLHEAVHGHTMEIPEP